MLENTDIKYGIRNNRFLYVCYSAKRVSCMGDYQITIYEFFVGVMTLSVMAGMLLARREMRDLQTTKDK